MSTIEVTEGSLSSLDRVMHRHWVGRKREIAEALALWRRVIQGEGQVLLLRGEPGVGKTRFVHELASIVSREGACVLEGECYAEGSPPYAPLSHLVREFLERYPRSEIRIPDETLIKLVPILPTLNTYFPEKLSEFHFHPPATREHVVEGFIAFCTTLSSHGSLLFVSR
jgi:DNA polymerase III delta prime subunit